MIDLSNAIARANLDTATLAARAELAPMRIEEIIKTNEATLGEMLRICDALGLPLSATRPSLIEPIKIKPRYLRANPRNIAEIGRVAEILNFCSSLLSRSPIANKFHLSPKRMKTFQQTASEAAALFRHTYFMNDQSNPITELPQILEDVCGINILVVQSSAFDGMSAKIDGQPFIVLANSFRPRMLFSLAHELAHLIFDFPENDGNVLFYEFIKPHTRNQRDPSEALANAFASELLLPTAAFAEVLYQIRERVNSSKRPLSDVDILLSARFFGVSFEVAAYRCEQLDLLPNGGAYALIRTLKRQFGTPEKRAEQLELPPRTPILFPTLPKAVIDQAKSDLAEGKESLGALSDGLQLPLADLMQLLQER